MESSVRVRTRRAGLTLSLCSGALVLAVGITTTSLNAQECGQVLVTLDAEYSFFRGTEEPSPDELAVPTLDWTDPDFDDSDWEIGPGGFGYGDRLDQIGTVLDDMRDSYPSVFLRTRFELDEPDDVGALALFLDYDDSFVAYINGIEVARRGLDGNPNDAVPYDTFGGGHESTGSLETIEILDLSMLDSENVLAVAVHNTTLNSSDLVWIAELVADPDTCPQALACLMDAGTGEATLSWQNRIASYDQIQILRKVDDGDFDILVDDIGGDQSTYVDSKPPLGRITYGVQAFDSSSPCDECPVLECTVEVFRCESLVSIGDEWVFLRGVDPGPDVEWVEEDFDDFEWEFGPTGIGYGDNDDATTLDDMQNSYVTVYTRKIVEIEGLDNVLEVRLAIVIDDGCVVYVNGQELGRYNMPGVVGDPVPNGTTASSANPGGDPSTNPAPIDFVVPKEMLEEGDNIFAVSVHNTSLTSSDLSFLPTICVVPGGDDPPPPLPALFKRGDADNDGNIVLTDAIFILAHLVQGGPAPDCADAADTDDDGLLVLTDAVRLLNALFHGQVPLPAPGLLECGEDPTDDALDNCPPSAVGCE